MENQQGNEAKADVKAPVVPTGDSSPSFERNPNEKIGSPSVNGASQGQAQEKVESIPFGDKRHPEYKRFRELSESARQAKTEADKLRREMDELRGFRDAMLAQQQQRQGPTMSPEQEQALEQIFGMGLQSEKVRSMIAKQFGLERLDEVHKGFSSFKENWEGQQYESEMREVLKYAEEQGLDALEIEPELREYVQKDPFFSSKEYYKGGVWAAFRNKNWDRIGELRERAENRKKIEERERLKSGQTQSPAETGNAANLPLPKKDGVGRNVEIIRRAGGIDKLPFFRR